MAPNPRRLDARLDALYKQVPSIECRGVCDDSCGPIDGSLREVQRIEAASGKTLSCGQGAACSMLTDERRCGVYEVRPMICRLLCAVLLEAARQLGYKAVIQPVRVRVLIPGGKAEFTNIGFAEPVEGRYNGHVVVVVDNKLAIDPTIAQLGGPFKRRDRLEPMLFEVERGFTRGEVERLEYRKWTVVYEPFDDKGDWASDMTSAISRVVRENGRMLAQQVRPARR